MSKCDLSIELDNPDQLYKTGDSVRCTIHVSVDKTVNCDGLTITNMWQTHGKGNQDSGTIATEELFRGEWQPGEYSYSCLFEIKEGPLTYRGHYINIDRYIKVRADIPWAIDPKTEIEYIVEKGNRLPALLSLHRLCENPMHGRDPTIVRPIGHQVADIHNKRILHKRRIDPNALFSLDL